MKKPFSELRKGMSLEQQVSAQEKTEEWMCREIERLRGEVDALKATGLWLVQRVLEPDPAPFEECDLRQMLAFRDRCTTQTEDR